jgi:L-lactate utilization protein LutB
MEEKLKALCELITKERQERLRKDKLDCEANLNNAVAHYQVAKKYTRVDVGGSGAYMVVNETGEIFGIKAYGVIHKGHFYGTLDTTNAYNWGGYRAVKK